MKKETQKEMKVKATHFKLQILNRRILASDWKEYYTYKKKVTGLPKGKVDENDSSFLKEFREELKKSEYTVRVTHIPSKVMVEMVSETINPKQLIKDCVAKIQEKRKANQIDKVIQRSFDGALIPTVGGVRTKPGLTNSFAQFLTVNDPSKAKTPRAKNKNYIGIELEFNDNIPGQTTKTIGDKLKSCGLSRYVHVGMDGSCGFEVRVLVEQIGFEEPLAKIMTVLASMGFTTDHRCGTHVHLDMRNRDVKVAYANLVKSQTFLRKFLTKQRKTNKFCLANKYSDFETQKKHQKDTGQRYYGINTSSLERHGTIEIRMHQGTLDHKILTTWIKTLLKVVDYKQEIPKKVVSSKQAVTNFKIETDLSNDIVSQIHKISGKQKLFAKLS